MPCMALQSNDRSCPNEVEHGSHHTMRPKTAGSLADDFRKPPTVEDLSRAQLWFIQDFRLGLMFGTVVCRFVPDSAVQMSGAARQSAESTVGALRIRIEFWGTADMRQMGMKLQMHCASTK